MVVVPQIDGVDKPESEVSAPTIIGDDHGTLCRNRLVFGMLERVYESGGEPCRRYSEIERAFLIQIKICETKLDLVTKSQFRFGVA